MSTCKICAREYSRPDKRGRPSTVCGEACREELTKRTRALSNQRRDARRAARKAARRARVRCEECGGPLPSTLWAVRYCCAECRWGQLKPEIAALGPPTIEPTPLRVRKARPPQTPAPDPSPADGPDPVPQSSPAA